MHNEQRLPSIALAVSLLCLVAVITISLISWHLCRRDQPKQVHQAATSSASDISSLAKSLFLRQMLVVGPDYRWKFSEGPGGLIRSTAYVVDYRIDAQAIRITQQQLAEVKVITFHLPLPTLEVGWDGWIPTPRQRVQIEAKLSHLALTGRNLQVVETAIQEQILKKVSTLLYEIPDRHLELRFVWVNIPPAPSRT